MEEDPKKIVERERGKALADVCALYMSATVSLLDFLESRIGWMLTSDMVAEVEAAIASHEEHVQLQLQERGQVHVSQLAQVVQRRVKGEGQ